MPAKIHGEVKRINGKRVATPEYRAWQNMKERCLNPKNKNYTYYGGRGIGICAQWINDVEQFISDVGRRPSSDMTLDRIDPDGDYCPENCRWVSREVQAQNRPYATTKAWLLAKYLGIKKMSAHHLIWQVRAKDRGDTKWFGMSPELEATVRKFLNGELNVEIDPCSNRL